MIDFVGWGWYRARASRTDVWPVVFEAWASDPTTHSATTSWAESLLDSCNKKQDGPKVITFFPFFVSKSKRMYPRLTKYLKYPISGHWNIVLVVALFAFPYVTSTKTSETVLFTRLILTLMNGLAWTQVQAECSWSLQNSNVKTCNSWLSYSLLTVESIFPRMCDTMLLCNIIYHCWEVNGYWLV